MTNWILRSRYQNALENEINFLTYLKLRQGIILEYARLKAKMDDQTFANALNISLEELKNLKTAPGTVSPQMSRRLKMLL